MRDAGGETACDCELLRAAERLLRKLGLLYLVADLILAFAAAQGGFESREQGFGAQRALEQEDVAEGLAQLAQALAFDGDASAGDEQDQGEVGPRGLIADDGLQLGDRVPFEGLFSEDGGPGACVDLAGELGDGGDDVAGIAGTLDDGADQLRVAAGRCENKGAGLAGRAWSRRDQRTDSLVSWPMKVGCPVSTPSKLASAWPTLMVPFAKSNSRIVRSCLPLRFFTTERAWWTVPARSK